MEVFLGLVLACGVGIWVAQDAKARGKSGGEQFLWWFGTFMLLIVFLPLWLLTRPPLPSAATPAPTVQLCPHCGKYYDRSPAFCPNCGQGLRGAGGRERLTVGDPSSEPAAFPRY